MSQRYAPLWSLCLALGGLVAAASPATAQQLRLILTPTTMTFADADPDTTPSIVAPAMTVEYRVRTNDTGNWRITVLAGSDLTAGLATIPISDVTWTASPVPPFQSGTLSRTVAQTLASGSGTVQTSTTGTVVFSLANRWEHNAGTYTATIVFTITAP